MTTASREWFNLLCTTIVQHVTKLKVPQFDIGGVPPRIAESEFVAAPNGKGFVRCKAPPLFFFLKWQNTYSVIRKCHYITSILLMKTQRLKLKCQCLYQWLERSKCQCSSRRLELPGRFFLIAELRNVPQFREQKERLWRWECVLNQ